MRALRRLHLLFIGVFVLVLPDFGRAQTAPGLEAAIENKLLNEHVVVSRDGLATDTVHIVVKANNEAAAQKIGQQPVEYSEALTDVEIVSAFTLKADGRKIPVSPTAVMTQLAPGASQEPLFDDLKQKVVLFPDVEAGDSIDFVFRKRDKQAEIAGQFMLERHFISLIAIDSADITVVAPKSYLLSAETHEIAFDRHDEGASTIYHWHYSRPKAAELETQLTSWWDRSPRLLLSSFKDYDAFAAAFARLIAPAEKVTPKMQALADQLTKGVSDRRQKAEKLYEWVSRHIRYVAVEIGAGGITPHDADMVLTNGYGDCKDHVVLYAALLKAKGIESAFVLINGRNSYELPKTPLVGQLDHAITWLPEFNLYADTTAGVAPFGALPFPEYGKPIVIATAAGGALKHVPLLALGTATVTTTTTARIDATGKIDGKSTITATGPFSIVLRQLGLGIETLGADRAADEILRRANVPGSGAFNLSPPGQLGPSYTLGSTWSMGPFAEIPLGRRFAMPEGLALLGVPGDLLVGSLTAQNANADDTVPCYSGHEEENISVDAPADYHFLASPPDAAIRTAHIDFNTHWSLNGRTLHLRRSFTSTIDTVLCSGALRAETLSALQAIRQSYLYGAAIAPDNGKPVAANDASTDDKLATVIPNTTDLSGSSDAQTDVASLSKGVEPQRSDTGDETASLSPDNAQETRAHPELATVATLERQHDFARAEKLLSTAIGAHEEAAVLYEQRGIVRDDRGHFDDATGDFTKAIAHALSQNEASRYYTERAFSYWLARDWKPALRDYGAAVAADERNTDAYLGRGRSELFAGRLEESIADFQKALSLKEDAYAALWLYIAEARAGKNARADIAELTAGWKGRDWPEPLLSAYLSGAASDAAVPADPREAAERDFFMGEFALRDGRVATARSLFKEAQKVGGMDEAAGVAAGLELAALEN